MALTKVPSNLDATIATTQSASDNSTNVATTAYVTTAVSNLVDGAPAALNTLNEIAAALNDDAALNTTLTNSIATKAPLASPTLTGNPKINVGTNKNIIFSGGIGEIGSVPGFQAINDAGSANTDFGIRATTIRLATGSAERMRIDSSGKVGIAEGGVIYASRFSVGKPHTHTPGSAFTNSPSSFYSEVQLGGTTGNDQKLVTFAGTDGSNVSGLALYRYRRATGTNWTTDGFSLRQEVDNTENIYDYINFTAGKVGIGTVTPNQFDGRANNLVVADTGDGGITIVSGDASDARIAFTIAADTGLSNGEIHYDNNNDQMNFSTGGSNRLKINNNGYIDFTGASDLRVTFGNTGTAGNNDANWVRGQAGSLTFNAASTGYIWEQTGQTAMTLRPNSSINANNSQLELYNAHPWIDLKAPDGAYFKAGITARGGASSTQSQFHLHITRDSGYRKLSTAGNYDTYLVTETANTAYGNLIFGTNLTEAFRIKAVDQTTLFRKQIYQEPDSGSGTLNHHVLPITTPNYPSAGQSGTFQNWYQPDRGESGMILYGNTNDAGGEYRCAGYIIYSSAEANNTPPAISISVTENIGGHMVEFTTSGGWIQVKNTYGYSIELMGYIQHFER